MKSMDKISTGIAYGTSAVSVQPEPSGQNLTN